MTTVVYVALASGDEAQGYHARIPDLPGCEASGANLGELLAHAREAVLVRLKAIEGAGEDWPKPTPLGAVAATAGSTPFLVDVQVEDTPVRVNISIGEQLLKRLDAAAETRGLTRSGFIAQAVRATLGERRRPEAAADFDAASRRLQEELSAMGRKISESLGPDSAFSRSMTDWDGRVSEQVRKAADQVSAAMARRRGARAEPVSETGGAQGASSGGGYAGHSAEGPADEAAAI